MTTNAEKRTAYRQRLKRLQPVPQVTEKLRRVLKSDREPSPEEAAEIAELIQQATKEIGDMREPEPERM